MRSVFVLAVGARAARALVRLGAGIRFGGL